MEKSNLLWFSAYQDVVAKCGAEPDWTLMEYQSLFEAGPVLDLAMGNGRNAFLFAKMGYEVDCVDISRTWVKKIRERAKVENLDMQIYEEDLRFFDIPKRRYSLIIASKILQLLRSAEIRAIAEKIYTGLTKHGMLYVRTFSIEHVKHSKTIKELEQVEPNTYYSPQRQQTYHFFTKTELPSLFPKLKVLYHIEGVEIDRSIKSPRYPWIIEFLGQRMR